MRTSVRSTLRDWFGSFGTNILLLIIGIITGIVGARTLGPEGRGELAAIMFWGGFVAQLGTLGLPSAVNLEAAQNGTNPRLTASVFALSLIYSALSLFVFGLLVICGITEVSQQVLVYAVGFVPANMLGLSLLSIDSGQQRFGVHNALRLVPQVTYLVLMLVLTGTGHAEPVTFAFAALAGSALVAIVRTIIARRTLLYAPESAIMRRLAVAGAQFYTTTVVGILRESADRIVILALLDTTALGVYAIALTIAGSAIQNVAGATTTILLPKVIAAADDAERARQLATATSASVFVAAVLNTAIAAASPLLIPLLFGAEFTGAVPVAIALCVGQTARSAADILSYGLRGFNDWKTMPATAGVALLVSLPLGLVLAKPFGPTGVALALLAGNLACFAFALVRARSRTGLALIAFLVPPSWLFSPATVIARLTSRT